jgi:hypothetical protein
MHRHQRKILAVVAALMVGLGLGIPLARHLTRTPVDGGPARPVAYQITYRTGVSSGSAAPGWEQLTVRRPFTATDLDYSERPGPGSVPTGGSAFTKDRLYVFTQAAFRLVSDRPPGAPGFDQDLLTQMPQLESRRLAMDLHQSLTIANRRCEMYRFLEPPSGAVAALSGTQHDDICLDRAGLELSEQWTLKGRVVQERQAVQVVMGGAPATASPAGSESLPASAVATASPDPSPQSFLPTPAPPDGFVSGQPELVNESSPQQPGQLLATEVTWYFSRGADIITVEAGESPPGILPWAGESTVTGSLNLTRLGRARSAIRSDGAELRVDLGDGQWVRIRGTVPLAGLIAYANLLQPPA